jgi:hypothetical protein
VESRSSADKDADLFIFEAKLDGRVDMTPGFIGGGLDGKLSTLPSRKAKA